MKKDQVVITKITEYFMLVSKGSLDFGREEEYYKSINEHPGSRVTSHNILYVL